MADETAPQEQPQSIEISAELYFLMQLVGEIAGSVCGPDFSVNVQPAPDGESVMLVMVHNGDPELGKVAIVQPTPDAEIRRVAVTMAAILYDAFHDKHDPASKLVVPEKRLIVPRQ